MREADLIAKIRNLEQGMQMLHTSLLQKESQLFAMWSVMNVLMHLLKQTPTLHLKQDAKTWLPNFMQMEDRPLYTQEEFEMMGKTLHEQREALIKGLTEKAKEENKPIDPDMVPKDNVQQAIDSLPTRGEFFDDKQPDLKIVRDNMKDE